METRDSTQGEKTVNGWRRDRATASTWKHNLKHKDTVDSHTDVQLYKWVEQLFYEKNDEYFMSNGAKFRLYSW